MGWNLLHPNAGFYTWDRVIWGTSRNWEMSGWRAALQKRIWGCWLAVNPVSPEGKPHPGVQQTQPHQPVRGDHPTVSSTGVASPRTLNAVLGPTIEKGCKGPWMHPEGSNKAGDRAGRNILRGTAEDFGTV